MNLPPPDNAPPSYQELPFSPTNWSLNERARRRVERMVRRADELRIRELDDGVGVPILDCGIDVPGSLQAGLALAEVCLADLGRVALVSGPAVPGNNAVPAIAVWTDHPLAACLFSQYAGWQIADDQYFAMGSGPMRASAGREKLFAEFDYAEPSSVAVGVLETRQIPAAQIAARLAEEAQVATRSLQLLVAPTGSLAGTIQIVARSVETALHKLHDLGFDLTRVLSGYGVAPLPPVGSDDLEAIGRTNDAVLYGADVTLWVTGDDDSLSEIVQRVPSNASEDHGQPFAEIFERYQRDFYKIDPHLFSPARITFNNLDTGRVFRAGCLEPDVLARSFGG